MKHCPEKHQLLANIDGEEMSTAVARHIVSCSSCQSSIAALRSDLAQLTQAADGLAADVASSLESRLRWQLQSGATTLRRERRGGLFPLWLVEHRALAFASAIVTVLGVLAFSLAGPTSTVSAAQVLERSYAVLFKSLEGSSVQRINYRIRYDGPSFGVIPEGTSDLVLDELRDRTSPVRFKVQLSTADGTLLRGFAQTGMTRRMVARTPEGNLDMTFQLRAPMPDLANLDARRQQLAQTVFRALTRVADPTRLSVVERDGTHVVELVPSRDLNPTWDAGMVELDSARVVVDQATYRVASAMFSGRLLGEHFKIAAEVVSVESLQPNQVVATDFDLPRLADAVELSGDGTSMPLADAARLLLHEAMQRRAVPAQ